MPTLGLSFIFTQVLLGFSKIPLGLIQVPLKFFGPVFGVFDGLLNTGDLRANGVVAALNFTKFFVALGMLDSGLFQLSVTAAFIGDQGFGF